jgi:hypothetical protein
MSDDAQKLRPGSPRPAFRGRVRLSVPVLAAVIAALTVVGTVMLAPRADREDRPFIAILDGVGDADATFLRSAATTAPESPQRHIDPMVASADEVFDAWRRRSNRTVPRGGPYHAPTLGEIRDVRRAFDFMRRCPMAGAADGTVLDLRPWITQEGAHFDLDNSTTKGGALATVIARRLAACMSGATDFLDNCGNARTGEGVTFSGVASRTFRKNPAARWVVTHPCVYAGAAHPFRFVGNQLVLADAGINRTQARGVLPGCWAYDPWLQRDSATTSPFAPQQPQQGKTATAHPTATRAPSLLALAFRSHDWIRAALSRGGEAGTKVFLIVGLTAPRGLAFALASIHNDLDPARTRLAYPIKGAEHFVLFVSERPVLVYAAGVPSADALAVATSLLRAAGVERPLQPDLVLVGRGFEDLELVDGGPDLLRQTHGLFLVDVAVRWPRAVVYTMPSPFVHTARRGCTGPYRQVVYRDATMCAVADASRVRQGRDENSSRWERFRVLDIFDLTATRAFADPPIGTRAAPLTRPGTASVLPAAENEIGVGDGYHSDAAIQYNVAFKLLLELYHTNEADASVATAAVATGRSVDEQSIMRRESLGNVLRSTPPYDVSASLEFPYTGTCGRCTQYDGPVDRVDSIQPHAIFLHLVCFNLRRRLLQARRDSSAMAAIAWYDSVSSAQPESDSLIGVKAMRQELLLSTAVNLRRSGFDQVLRLRTLFESSDPQVAFRRGAYGYRNLFPSPLPDFVSSAGTLVPRTVAGHGDAVVVITAHEVPKDFPKAVRVDEYGQPEVEPSVKTPSAPLPGWKLVRNRCAWPQSTSTVFEVGFGSPLKPSVKATAGRTCYRHPGLPESYLTSLDWAIEASVLQRRWVLVGCSHSRYHFGALATAFLDVAQAAAERMSGIELSDAATEAFQFDNRVEYPEIGGSSDVSVLTLPSSDEGGLPVPVALFIACPIVHERCARRALGIAGRYLNMASDVTDVFFTNGPWELLNAGTPLALQRKNTAGAVTTFLEGFPNAMVSVSLTHAIALALHNCNSPLRQRVTRDAMHAGVLTALFNATAADRNRVVVWDSFDLTALRRTEAVLEGESTLAIPAVQPAAYGLGVEARRGSEWLPVGDGTHYHPPLLMNFILQMFLTVPASLRSSPRLPTSTVLDVSITSWDDEHRRTADTRDIKAVAAWRWSESTSTREFEAARSRFLIRQVVLDERVQWSSYPAPPPFVTCSKCLDFVRFGLFLHNWCHDIRVDAVAECEPPPNVSYVASGDLVAELVLGLQAARCLRTAFPPPASP